MSGKLLVFSQYALEDGTSGALLLHRHLAAAAPRWEARNAALVGSVPPGLRLRRRRWHAALASAPSRRLQRLANAWDALGGAGLDPGRFRRILEEHRPDVVLALADGAVAIRAWQAARRRGLPLVVVLHDWYPGGLDVPERLRPAIEGRLRRICRESAVSLSVCEEMRAAAGGGTNARVLYPIPDPDPAGPAAEAPGEAFYALFAGRFDHFLRREMLALAQALREAGRARELAVIGPLPERDAEISAVLRRDDIHRGFLKGAELRSALRRAPAHLVICPFGPESRHIARCSFPSKIPEYCPYGRPIVVWGPEDAAAVRWARAGGAALAATDPSPRAVLDALAGLAADPGLRLRLGARAAEEARGRFDPARLRAQFEDALHFAAGRQR